jgi:CheY-like chemotaxis protein
VAPEGAPTILVIEDDASDRERLAAVLVGAGFAVETAETGAEAIERCTARSYDAITLDLLLPDMTGLEVLQRLRTSRNRNVPVVVITVVAERGAVAGFAWTPAQASRRSCAAVVARARGISRASGRRCSSSMTTRPRSGHVGDAQPAEAVCDRRFEGSSARSRIARRRSPDLIMPGAPGSSTAYEVVAGRTSCDRVTSKDLTSDERAASGVPPRSCLGA